MHVRRTTLPLTLVLLLGCASTRCAALSSSVVPVTATPQTFVVTPLPSPTPVAASTPTRDERWREDLHYLAQELPRRHPKLFATPALADEFTKAVDELDEAIPSLRDEEVIAGIMRVLAVLEDAHTFLDVTTVFRTYPLRLFWFSGGLYVIRTTPEYQRALGTRLVQIEDTDVSTASDAVGSVISHENDAWLSFETPNHLVLPELLYGLGILSDVERGAFVFEESDGTRFALDLVPLAPDAQGVQWLHAPDPDRVAVPLYLKDQVSFYWYEYLEDSRAVYVQYNTCHDMPGQSFAEFTRELFAFVDSHPVERFIVDLRANTGGSDHLIHWLTDGLPTLDAVSQRGRLFVIIGRLTFSSGMLAAIDLKDLGAILVGEPTGGKPNFYGAESSFRLPNSDLRVSHASAYIWSLEDDPPSLMPDVFIPVSADDYFAGRDPVLEAILAYEDGG